VQTKTRSENILCSEVKGRRGYLIKELNERENENGTGNQRTISFGA